MVAEAAAPKKRRKDKLHGHTDSGRQSPKESHTA